MAKLRCSPDLLDFQDGIKFPMVQFNLVQSLSHVRPHGLQHTRLPCPSSTPGAFSNSCWSSRWSHPTISPCHPLLLLPSIYESMRVFSNESVLHIRWPKYWSFSFSIRPSNEYSGLISFRTDCLGLLAVQRTLKSLLQYQNSKAWTLQCSAFFMVQLSHPYLTNEKTIALTRQTFVANVMSLLFNMLFMFVIAFLPRNKHLLISWLKSPSVEVCHCFPCFPIYLPWSDENGCHDLSFLNFEF